MNASQSSPTGPLEDDRKKSPLERLRELHSALLQRTRAKTETGQPTTDEMLGFIGKAREIGALLGDLDSRETAQGLLDFWAGRVLSTAPQVAERSGHFELDEYRSGAEEAAKKSELSEDEQLKQACKEGDKIGGELDAKGQVSLNRLLLGLFRLKERSIDPYPIPLAANDSWLADPQVKDLAVKLEAAGLLRRRALESGGEVIELASPKLLARWKPLQKMVVERRALRQLAMGWENSGREAGALLLGEDEKFSRAMQIPGRDQVESDFLEESAKAQQDRKGQKTKEKNRIIAGLVAGLLLVVGLLIWALIERGKANTQLGAAIEAKEAAVKATREALDANALAFTEARRAEAEAQNAQVALKEATRIGSELRFIETNLGEASKEKELAEQQITILEKTGVVTADQVEQVKATIVKDLASRLPDLGSLLPPTTHDPIFTLSGPAFILHPQTDPLVKPDETMALIRRRNEVSGDLLLPAGPDAKPTDRPLFNQLNPTGLWVTAGWNYGLTNRQWLVGHKAKLVNKRNSKQVQAQPVDWGNRSGHAMNISQGVAQALDMQPGDEIELSIETQPPLPPPTAE